jgi:hypothetical protein
MNAISLSGGIPGKSSGKNIGILAQHRNFLYLGFDLDEGACICAFSEWQIKNRGSLGWGVDFNGP